LGGIGSGCIGLAGDGRLVDWEIFNRPNKGSLNGFSHFGIKAEAGGKVVDARVLNGDLRLPYTGEMWRSCAESLSGAESGGAGFGFGPVRDQMAGVSHFRHTQFRGEYPIASLRFRDYKFPGEVQLIAFNPYIPLNERDSSIPAAFFEIGIKNTAKTSIDYTVCLSLQNPFPKGSTINAYGRNGKTHFIKLSSSKFNVDDPEFGDLTIATDAKDASYQEYWFRGHWFDNLGIYWRELTSSGKFKNRHYPEGSENIQDLCLLAAHLKMKPNETGSARFIISWSFPNCHHYWAWECDCAPKETKTWKNYYATLFEDSTKSAVFSLENWERLYQETVRFKDALFSSTLPPFVLDAISSNLSILKTPTSLRLEDGTFYGWEGCRQSSGCCEGSCTHVWNYAYVLPFLFPTLERSMRDLDFKHNMREDGGMSFRLQLPLGTGLWSFPHACADGQFGGVIKSYRDWKISGDSSWLKSNWEAIKKSVEYAWAETNEDKWDLDKDGIIEGRQHNTLDMELFGPNSWPTGFYLAALKAAAEMAEHIGEDDKAREYRDLFQRGKKWADRNLFNGEYYGQIADIRDRSILERFKSVDPDVENTYWDPEHREIKYQIGDGCEVDQVLAQWHANICGLGEIFDREKTKKALGSIVKYNFKKSMRDFFNPFRIYSLNDEAGLVNCEWPKGKSKPAIPIHYAGETWCGSEYAAASHMIQEGLVDEGLEVVRAVRARHDGEKRNPWNEFECGSNYARSMASYALLLALSGFQFDMTKGYIGFNPARTENGRFKSFWSLNRSWGTFNMKPNLVEIRVEGGELEINTLKLPFLRSRKLQSISLGRRTVNFKNTNGEISLRDPVLIKRGNPLVIRIRV
jgi:non-lysosomal glucosylceramidase